LEIAKNQNNDTAEKTETNNMYDYNIEFEENDDNKIFTKKRVSKLMKKDKFITNDGNNIIQRNIIKKGDNIFYRNDKRGNNLVGKDIYNKTELKESNINKIINSINNENKMNNSNRQIYSDIKINEKKRRFINANTNTNANYNLNLNKKENNQRNPIRIEEGEEENISKDLQDNKHRRDEKNLVKNFGKYSVNLNRKEENEKKEEKEDNKINNSSSSFFSKVKNESSKMKLTLGRYELRRGYKGSISNNEDISKDKHFQYSQTSSSIFDKNLDGSKTHVDIMDSNGTKKVSIRNKYKMRRIKEIV